MRLKDPSQINPQHRGQVESKLKGKDWKPVAKKKSKQSKYRNKPCLLCSRCQKIWVKALFDADGSFEECNLGGGEYLCPDPECSHPMSKDDKFDSMLEARVYIRLCEQHGKENVVRQVSIPLGNGARIQPDFMVIYDIEIGSIHWQQIEIDLWHPLSMVHDTEPNKISEWFREPQYAVVKFMDAKGKPTRGWTNKCKWLKKQHGLEIEMVRK